MDNNNILREIIDVEKEIQLSLDQAKETTRIWLDERKKEMLEDLAREEKIIIDSFRQSREKLALEAASKADDLVRRAEREADLILRLNNEILNKIVANHIHKILPGDP